MIDPIEIDRLKSQIVEIIGSRIELRKAGANFKARCPFHEDKHPSLMVSEAKRSWRCFVCNVGGGAIDFVMQFNHTDFKGALEILGIKIEQSNPQSILISKQISEAFSEIEKDATALLQRLEEREEHLEYFSRQVVWLMNAVSLDEREVNWYQWEKWVDGEFVKIEIERERIHAIARRHKKEVLEWAKQKA